MGALEEFGERQRKIWSTGDFGKVAPSIAEVSTVVVDRVGVESGHDVLDVATGTGNAALLAAERGARVTGLDFVPELLTQARERASSGGLEAEWVEGDAQELPFADASFDRVTSVFGAMFAPRHAQTAAEMVRVARPGGRIGVAAWTPTGLNGQLFAVMGSHMPPPPPEIEPPVLWGDQAHVESLFDSPRVDVSCERLTAAVRAESVEAWVDFCERFLGPVRLAKAALEPEGRWEPARADLLELYARWNKSGDATLDAPAEYLLTLCRVGD